MGCIPDEVYTKKSPSVTSGTGSGALLSEDREVPDEVHELLSRSQVRHLSGHMGFVCFWEFGVFFICLFWGVLVLIFWFGLV